MPEGRVEQSNTEQATQYDNDVLVLCGGKGTRLKPWTDEIPKALVQLQGKPILEYIYHLNILYKLLRPLY